MDETDKTLLIETNGTVDIAAVPPGAIAIVDIKTPGSGESESTDWDNVDRLHPDDEVKFVLTDRADYEWAKEVVAARGIADRCRTVHFSPASGQLPPASLAEWICEDALPVRLHLQLHKLAGVK
jgi:7-carboxy-7-deazaguanine synthase